MFDLNVYPYPVSERLFAPGFLVFPPKEKAARGRDNNLLILYFTLTGQTPITPEGLRNWMEQKAEAFHRNAGTVTAGIRELVESINADLYDRNIRPERKSSQVLMNLQVVVLKKEMITLANCGSGQSFLVANQETLIFHDNEETNRGLGSTQSISIRFSQSTVKSGDLLLMSFNAPATWTSQLLSGGESVPLEVFARRLFTSNTTAGKGVIVRFLEGTGKMSCLRIGQSPAAGQSSVPAQPEPAVPSNEEVIPLSSEIRSQWIPASSVSETQKTPSSFPQSTEESVSSPSASVNGIQMRRISHPSAPGNPRATPTGEPEGQKDNSEFTRETAETSTSRSARFENSRSTESSVQSGTEPVGNNENDTATPLIQTETVKAVLGKTLRKGAEVKTQTDEMVKDIAQKVLPGDPNKPVHFPRWLLVFIAVAIPVLIVTIALSVYIRNGRNSEVVQYITAAQQDVAQSNTQMSDTTARISSLQSAIAELDKADTYGTTADSIKLRNTVQSLLDTLQGVDRVDMASAVSDLTLPGVNITQLVATNTDLYALDAISGKILRFTMSGSSYAEDTNFDCGPNPKNPINTVGKLVDMVPIPTNNSYGATIMAIDSAGTLDYCVPGGTGYIVGLSAPDLGWGTIQSMTLYNNDLYILDVKGNAVYRYEGTGIDFKDKPTLFFDETIPQLTTALDIEEQGYELYILRSSGDMVECTYSPLKDMKSTACQEPASFLDPRTGQDITTTTFSGTKFTQLHLTEAPDSSLYILDAANDQVYHFSYIRSLQDVLTPRMTDGSDIKKLYPTAFTVSSTRILFIAFSNQIYFGQIQ